MSKRRIDIDELAGTFKALSNPQRLKIFLALASCCPPGCCVSDPCTMRRCVGELGENLDLAPSTVSHHLKELRQAGLMNVERRGKRIECWLSEEAIAKVAALFANTQVQARALLGKTVRCGGKNGKRTK